MLLELGSFLDIEAIILEIRKRWRYSNLEPHQAESANTISSINEPSNDPNIALNKDADKQKIRHGTLQAADQLRRVRGFHFGKQDELLPHEEGSVLLGTDSGISISRRSSVTSLVSCRTPLSDLYTDDAVTPAEVSVTEDASQNVSTDPSFADRLWSRFKDAAYRQWNKQPQGQQHLEPCWILVSIIEPFTQVLRSLDVPCPSSITSYKQASYFPETDTFFLPCVAGGPFEVAAAEVDQGRWIEVTPAKFWKFRESALKELRETGKLQWRKVDRWGKKWEEGWWKGEGRPKWNQGARRWRCEAVRC